MKHKTLRFQAAKGNCGSKGACGRASLDLPLFLMSQIKKSSCNLVETVFFEIQLANLQFRSCYRVRLRKKSEVRSFFKLRHLTLKLWFCWKKQCLEVSRKSSMEWSYHIFVWFFFNIFQGQNSEFRYRKAFLPTDERQPDSLLSFFLLCASILAASLTKSSDRLHRSYVGI